MNKYLLPRLFSLLILLPAIASAGLIEEVTAVRDSLQTAYRQSTGIERDRIAFQLGLWLQDTTLTPESNTPEAEALFHWSLLKRAQYDWLLAWGETIKRDSTLSQKTNPTVRLLFYRFEELRDNIAYVRTTAEVVNDPQLPTPSGPECIALGDIAFRQFDYDRATHYYASAWYHIGSPILQTEAILGYLQILGRKLQFQTAVDTLTWALHNSRAPEKMKRMKRGFGDEGKPIPVPVKQTAEAHNCFSDALIYELASALIPLGRVNEAIALFDLTLEVNPYHQDAHYFLGNGYSTLNYSQLSSTYQRCFPVGKKATPILEIKTKFAAGDFAGASELADRLIEKHPKWLQSYVVRAEVAWLDGDLPTAERLCLDALRICPAYGRAHSILARVYESAERRVNVHNAEDEAAFAAADFPLIPDIEAYIPNWKGLTPRIQKRVAMSLEPWKNFIPVLAATGQTHYIKPLYMKLSECPMMENIADQRVGLDSRLWDDVRGAGGFHTVTGVEDVERIIFRSYNTVLHELTHQVHGTLTEPDKQRIERAFLAAKARAAAGTPAFLTDYASNNEWEYFAEGVNSYYSPRRDEFDRRELVKERLLAMDTALVALVEHFTSVTDVQPYLVEGMVGAADDMLEWGKADSALIRLGMIPKENADARSVLRSSANVNSILDRDSTALALAQRMVDLFPGETDSYNALAQAQVHSNRDPDPPRRALEDGLQRPGVAPRHRLFLSLGNLASAQGRYGDALDWFDSALVYQQDQPDALWGMGVAWGDSTSVASGVLSPDAINGVPSYDSCDGKDAGEWCQTRRLTPLQSADSLFIRARGFFDRVIPERSGTLELRLDYARILMAQGDDGAASAQIAEAVNLRPNDPLVWTYQAWLALARGEKHAAKKLLKRALKANSPPDLAKILMARIKGAKQMAELDRAMSQTVPYYRFNQLNSQYESVGDYPAWQRKLLR